MKIMLVDDHVLFREGMVYILKDLSDKLSIVQAADVDQLLAFLNEKDDFDLVLMDIFMPGKNAFDALGILRSQYPALPVVVLSASTNPKDMEKAIKLGAMGYICKDSSSKVMLTALNLVLSGEVYIPSAMMTAKPQTRLTPRQLEVMTLMAEGLSNKLIADRIHISEPTVKMHVTAIFRELGVSNRTQAVLKAREMQILSQELV